MGEAFRISSVSASLAYGVDSILAERLEEQIWRSEHPGCTMADFEAFRHERFMEKIENASALLKTAAERNGWDLNR